MSEFFEEFFFSGTTIQQMTRLVIFSLIVLTVFIFILRMTDKNYRKQFSKDEKIKKLEENLVEYDSELKNLLPKVDPLEKKQFESKYDPKKIREVETELLNLKGRIQTLERFLKTDRDKLKKLREKN